ncbi:MAG: lipopolysaccharide kinase InaA family protein, partial [Planctomycetota bacterium]
MTRTVLVAPEWRARLAALGLADPAALLEAGDPACRFGGRWELLSKPGLGGRSRWRWTLPPDATPSCPRPAAPPGAARPAFAPVLYVKRYERASLREQLDRIRRQAARHSRAWWEYRQSHELGRRGIAAVRAVAMADEQCGSGWCEFRSVVVFEAAAGDAFDRIWPRLVAAGDPLTCAPRRHELTRQLARFVAAFHETGICHRDLYLCHVFLDVSGDSPAEAGWAEAGT